MSDTPAAAPAAPLKLAGARRSYGGVAPEARRAHRRQRLVEAGIEVFGTRGFHHATVREVCAAARLTERYFYESFKGLPELFAEVYERINAELMRSTLEALAAAEPTPLALAEAGLRRFLAFVREDPRRARIALIDAVSIHQAGTGLAVRAARDYVELMKSFVHRLYPDAEARGVSVQVLSEGLVGMNTHIATNWVRSGFALPLETVLASNLLAYRGLDRVVRDLPAPVAGGTQAAQ